MRDAWGDAKEAWRQVDPDGHSRYLPEEECRWDGLQSQHAKGCLERENLNGLRFCRLSRYQECGWKEHPP